MPRAWPRREITAQVAYRRGKRGYNVPNGRRRWIRRDEMTKRAAARRTLRRFPGKRPGEIMMQRQGQVIEGEGLRLERRARDTLQRKDLMPR